MGRGSFTVMEKETDAMCVALSWKTACFWGVMKGLGIRGATEEHWASRNQSIKRKDSQWAEMTPH